MLRKGEYVVEEVERCGYKGKVRVGVRMEERVWEEMYGKDGKREKEMMKGEERNGMGEVMERGEIVKSGVKDGLSDVDM